MEFNTYSTVSAIATALKVPPNAVTLLSSDMLSVGVDAPFYRAIVTDTGRLPRRIINQLNQIHRGIEVIPWLSAGLMRELGAFVAEIERIGALPVVSTDATGKIVLNILGSREQIQLVQGIIAEPRGPIRDSLDCDIEFSVQSIVPDGMLLEVVKVYEPVTLDAMAAKLQSEFDVRVEKTALSRMLDRLRRKGLLIWQRLDDAESGTFAITLQGLKYLPVQRRSTASDIRRILALNRRKD